jgi:hypothetical protein
MDLAQLRNYALSFDRAVEVKPLWYGEAKDQEVKGWKGIYNQSKKAMATLAGEDYNLAQHTDVVQGVADALLNLNIKADSRVGDSGNVIFVDINFPETKIGVKKGEEFFAGIRLINSYNKTTGIIIAPRYMRLVCSNGMVMPSRMVKHFNVRHDSSMAKDFALVIPEIINQMVSFEPKLREIVEKSIADSIEWDLMKGIIRKLAVSEKHMKEIEARLPQNPTRWDLYNAFTNYATHGSQLKPSVEQRLLTKAQVLLDTPLAMLVVPEAE